jgi:hypothetical protein
VEQPELAPDGRNLCFLDLAIARGHVRPEDATYSYELTDERRRRLGGGRAPAAGPRTCLPLPSNPPPYAVLAIRASGDNRDARPARVHLSVRAGKGLEVVGLERDEI